jgi:putative redox protein
MPIDCSTETPGAFRQVVRVDAHTLHADVGPALGGQASAPGPHDYFDTALATCKALTATWYARQHAIPLDRVEAHVERDDSKERQGIYVLKVRLAFHGALSDEQRRKIYDAVSRCPIHKLMTTADVQIETAPLA